MPVHDRVTEKAESIRKKKQYAMELEEQIRSKVHTDKDELLEDRRGVTDGRGRGEGQTDRRGLGEGEREKSEAYKKKREYAMELEEQMRNRGDVYAKNAYTHRERHDLNAGAHAPVNRRGDVVGDDMHVLGERGIDIDKAEAARRKREYAMDLQEQIREQKMKSGVLGSSGVRHEQHAELDKLQAEREKAEAVMKKQEYAMQLQEQIRNRSANRGTDVDSNLSKRGDYGDASRGAGNNSGTNRGIDTNINVSKRTENGNVNRFVDDSDASRGWDMSNLGTMYAGGGQTEAEGKEREKAEALRKKREYAMQLEQQMRENQRNRHAYTHADEHYERTPSRNPSDIAIDPLSGSRVAHHHLVDALSGTPAAHHGSHRHLTPNDSDSGMVLRAASLAHGSNRHAGTPTDSDSGVGMRGASFANIGVAEAVCNADADARKAQYAQELRQQVCTCIAHMNICMYMYFTYEYMHVCIHACIPVSVVIWNSSNEFVCVNGHVCMYVRVYLCAYMFHQSTQHGCVQCVFYTGNRNTCMNTYMHIFIRKVHIHAYIHMCNTCTHLNMDVYNASFIHSWIFVMREYLYA